MYTMIVALLLFIFGVPAEAPSVPAHPAVLQPASGPQETADALLASLTKYQIGLVWRGPKWTPDASGKMADHRKKHKEDIAGLVKNGTLVGSAEVVGDGDFRGVIFFKVQTPEEATTIVNGTYAVKQEFLKATVHQVWGTKGLGKELKGGISGSKKNYYLAVYSKGKAWRAEADEKTREQIKALQARVSEYLNKGVVKFYAAIDDTGPTRGVMIFSAASLGDAKKRINDGEAVKSGWFATAVYKCAVPDGVLP